jgi:acyl-coenzyme A thioesterase PaaI-like protein
MTLAMRAIQDSIPHNHCWGCGTLNPRGLQIKSYWDGEESVCNLQPAPEFMAGPTDVLYGGYIAAVIDCHCICTAIAHAYRVAGREIGAEPLLWSVTASLKIDYLAPTPIGSAVELRARVREHQGRKRVVECLLRADGKERARAEVLAIEVPGTAWSSAGAGRSSA